MKIKLLILSCILSPLFFSSCKSTPDENTVILTIADKNLKIAEEAQEPVDQEKYYKQALSQYVKYISIVDNSDAKGEARLELEADDIETVIEAKIKAKKCIGVLKDKFKRTCVFPDNN